MAIETRINRDGSTSYHVRVRDSVGKAYPVKAFGRKVDARDYEGKLLNERVLGTRAENSSQSKIIFDEYFTQWSKECRSKISIGWKKTQDQMYRHHIAPLIGQYRLGNIRPRDVLGVITAAQTSGLGRSMQKHIYVLLSTMFLAAVEHYEILKVSPVHRKFRPKQTTIERQFLKKEQSLLLMDAVKGTRLEWPIKLALYCGFRVGEIQALRWKAVDLVNDRIVIRATFNRRISQLQDHPKQGDWGQVPIPGVIKEELMKLSLGRNPDEFVVTGKNGSCMLDYNSFLIALKRKCVELGLPAITCHELRHSSSELWYSYGASAEDIRRLLNHKNVSTTQRYIHRTEERLSRLAGEVGT